VWALKTVELTQEGVGEAATFRKFRTKTLSRDRDRRG
jgi:hypothetical protein